MQGFNIKFLIKRPSQSSDDSVGGSVITYATAISSIPGRIQAMLEDEDIMTMNPGLQTEKLFRVTCQSSNLDIRENDLLVIFFPTNHHYYNKNFRVLKVTHANYYPKNYMILTVSLSEEGHTLNAGL